MEKEVPASTVADFFSSYGSLISDRGATQLSIQEGRGGIMITIMNQITEDELEDIKACYPDIFQGYSVFIRCTVSARQKAN